MNKSELKQLIKEEISTALNEGYGTPMYELYSNLPEDEKPSFWEMMDDLISKEYGSIDNFKSQIYGDLDEPRKEPKAPKWYKANSD